MARLPHRNPGGRALPLAEFIKEQHSKALIDVANVIILGLNVCCFTGLPHWEVEQGHLADLRISQNGCLRLASWHHAANFIFRGIYGGLING